MHVLWLVVLLMIVTSQRVIAECGKFYDDAALINKLRDDLHEHINRTFSTFNVTRTVDRVFNSEVLTVTEDGNESENIDYELTEEIDVDVDVDVDVSTPWFSFSSNFLPKDLSINCRRDTTAYLRELGNLTEWAVRMLDASAKMPQGILMGNIRTLGDFDECLWVKATEGIEPQYCISNIIVDTEKFKVNHPKWFKLLQTITYHRLDKETKGSILGTLPVHRSAMIEWAVCVPASCSPLDVEKILNGVANYFLPNANVQIKVESRDCYRNDPKPELSSKDRAIISGLLLIIAMVIIGSIYDSYDSINEKVKDMSLLDRILRAFSLKRSWNELTNFSERRCGQIDCIDGMRSFSAIWVVIGHQGVMSSNDPFVNKVTHFNTHKYFVLLPLWNFFLAVDTFLVIGGLVRCYTTLRGLENRTIDHVRSFLQRYFRLTPALLVVIGIYISVIKRLASGPYWNRQITTNVHACELNWWKTILYFNNYSKDEYYRCILQSWYTSLDMQLFLIAPLMIVPLWIKPKIGLVILSLVTIICFAIQIATMIFYDLPALPITFQRDDKALLNHLYRYYYPGHTRALPYVIGIFTGYFMYYHKTVTFSKVQLVIGWCLSLIAFAWPMLGAHRIISSERTYNACEHILFGTLHKSVWALSMAWIILICHHGYGGIINKILSLNIFKFIARISYSIFVSHLGLLIILSGHLRGPKHMNLPAVLNNLLGELLMILIQATVLHLFVEAPFCSLASIFIGKKKQPVKKIE